MQFSHPFRMYERLFCSNREIKDFDSVFFGSLFPIPSLVRPFCIISCPQPHYLLLSFATCSSVLVLFLTVLSCACTRPLRSLTIFHLSSPSFPTHHVIRTVYGIHFCQLVSLSIFSVFLLVCIPILIRISLHAIGLRELHSNRVRKVIVR